MQAKPKRIILMYISEVSGHHSATLAIEKAIKILQPQAQVLNINTFNYTNPISEKIVNRIYMGIIKRTPKIWEYLYDNPKIARKVAKIKDAIHRVNAVKLKNLFDKFKPDVVACAQAFPCGMVADFKNIYNSNIGLVAVLTDYIPHSYWVYDSVDCYIAPSDEVAMRLIKKGVEKEKIRPFGIPFDPKFKQGVDKTKVIQKLKLDVGVPTLLIMGGGQGIGPIKTIVTSLDKAGAQFQEIVVAGTNKKLYKSLKGKIRKQKRKIALLGYVDNIHELMDVSDVIITKPGGVTTAEALAKNLAMIIINPIPGQEASNTAYLTSQKAAIKVDDPKQIKEVINDLFSNHIKLKRLREQAALLSKPNASFDIAKFLLAFPRHYV
ncbi:MAG: glycosyltransferase [Candidatus Omnitrophota bacterium]